MDDTVIKHDFTNHPVRLMGRWSFRYWYQYAKFGVAHIAGKAFEALHTPGAVRAWETQDRITGCKIAIRTSALSTVINVNGMDYYFNRLTGKYIGCGMYLGSSEKEQADD